MGSGSSRKKAKAGNDGAGKNSPDKSGFIDAGELETNAENENKTGTVPSAATKMGMREGK